MNKLPRSYWTDARDEAMRKARNAAFYAGCKDITDQARKLWTEIVADHVQRAREFNRNAVRS